MAITIGEGILKVRADTTELQKEVNSISAAFSNLKSILAGLGISLIFKEITQAVKESVFYLDEMAKGAKKLGMSVEEYSRMAYVANLAGTSIDNFRMSWRMLSNAITEAAAGNEETKKIFQELGVSITNADGSVRNINEVFKDFVNALSKVENNTLRTNLAVKFLGRGAIELMPFINQGAEAFEKLERRADELGITIDSRTAASAERLKDHLTTLHLIMKNQVNSSLVEVINRFYGTADAMERFENDMSKYIKNTTQGWVEEAEAVLIVSKYILGLLNILKDFYTGQGYKILQDIQQLFGKETKEIKVPKIPLADFSKISDEEKAILKSIEGQKINEAEILKLLGEHKEQKEKIKKIEDEIITAQGKNITEQMELSELMREKIAPALKEVYEKIGMKGIKLITPTTLSEAEAYFNYLRAKIREFDETIIGEHKKSFSELAERASIYNIYNQQILPLIQQAEKLKISLPEALKVPPGSKEELQEILKIIQEMGLVTKIQNAYWEEWAKKFQQMGQAFGSTGEIIASIYEMTGENSRSLFKFLQVLRAAEMLMNGLASIAQAAAQGGIYGFAIGLAIFAKILAFIAQLKSITAPDKPKVVYPRAEQGAIVKKEMLVNVAEYNKPEAIIPLDKYEKYFSNQKIEIRVDVSNRAEFLRSLAFEIQRIQKREMI